jgi:hypothetical protein
VEMKKVNSRVIERIGGGMVASCKVAGAGEVEEGGERFVGGVDAAESSVGEGDEDRGAIA